MTEIKNAFSLALNSDEYIQIDDRIYTSREALLKEKPEIHIIGSNCLKILKSFEENLTQEVVEEWILLSRALDQTCSFHNKWDDKKIINELLKGTYHPVSWYIENCQTN